MAATKQRSTSSGFIALQSIAYGPDGRYTAEPGDLVKSVPEAETKTLLDAGVLERATASPERRQAEIRASATTVLYEIHVTGAEARAMGKGNRERAGIAEEALEARPADAPTPAETEEA